MKIIIVVLGLVLPIHSAYAQDTKQVLNVTQSEAILEAILAGTDLQAEHLKFTLKRLSTTNYSPLVLSHLEPPGTIVKAPNGQITFEVVRIFVMLSEAKAQLFTLTLTGLLNQEQPPYQVKVLSITAQFNDGGQSGGNASSSGGRIK